LKIGFSLVVAEMRTPYIELPPWFFVQKPIEAQQAKQHTQKGYPKPVHE